MEPFFVLSKHRANREFHKFTFSSWLQQILILGDNSHRYKKGNRKDPGVYGIFSVASKRKGTLGMSPFLPSSRKNDSL